jgi:hypothetical protein
MKLSLEDRAALAERPLASLEERAEVEEAWAVEVERRIAEVEAGAVDSSLSKRLSRARVRR